MLLPFARESIESPEVSAALHQLATQSTEEERGTVYTSRAIVDALLDLIGYTPDRDLASMRLLEPSFGAGDFLLVALERLLQSHAERGGEPIWSAALAEAITAVEIHEETYSQTKANVLRQLQQAGFSDDDAHRLAAQWLQRDDFLLAAMASTFSFIVGNPPYVRQERIPKVLLQEYKQRYETLYDRADLYVLFYERALDLLAEDGRLGFICANRWLKNKYGGPLREKIVNDFQLLYHIDMSSHDAFDREVLAYPAITVLGRCQQQNTPTLLAAKQPQTSEALQDLTEALRLGTPGKHVISLQSVGYKRDPWLLDAPHVLEVLRHLEERLPTLEADGCKVGIGVATGCDRVFIGEYEELPVEESRKLPLAMAADLQDGDLVWRGKGIVNPFTEDGRLAQLDGFPLFKSYLESHQEALKKRYVAKKQPHQWYRTIDKISTPLTGQPKLLIPDIKGDAAVVYDEGHYYPHHNLYVITSQTWDLRALQSILRSSMALMFVAAYSVRMAGGFLRFQAQYLRRIRLPSWETLTNAQRQSLIDAASWSSERIDELVFPLYAVNDKQKQQVQAFASGIREGSR